MARVSGIGGSVADTLLALMELAGPTGQEEPVLAWCRSGTRSIVTWSAGEALAGTRSRQDLIGLGAGAGYDLSGVLG